MSTLTWNGKQPAHGRRRNNGRRPLVISAVSSAQAGMTRASNWMDAVARQVSADTAFTTSALSAPVVGAAAQPWVGNANDGWVDAMPNILIASTLFKANASVARQADEAYRSVLDLIPPRE
jgi:hypothetical protein